MKRNRLFFVLLFILSALCCLVACEGPSISYTSLVVDESEVEINIGDTYNISYTVSGITNLAFTSSDEAIAMVEGGVITALKEGSVTITITADDLSATVTVTVVDNRKVIISFDSNIYGFKMDSIESKYGTDVTLPTAPTMEDYTFLGYALKSDAKTYITKLENVTADTKVYALYESNKTYHEVKFELNGGSCEAAKGGKIEEGTVLDLSKMTPEKEGSIFLGWTLEATSTAYIESYTVNAAATIYAQFQANTYTITYELDGGTLYTAKRSVDYGTTLELPTPIKVGFEFKGWTLEENGTTYITKLENIKANTTVYANYEVKSYTITYNIDNGSLQDAKETITAVDVYTLPNPSKEGFTFLGWTTSEYSSVYVTELKNISADVVLYAHFTDGLVATPTTLESVLNNAKDGDKITLLSGSYSGTTITKKVTLSGPNAGIDPVNEDRGAEARFTGTLVVNASGVIVDGIEIYGAGILRVLKADDVTIKNVLITDTTVANTGATVCALEGVSCKNLKITQTKLSYSEGGESNRIMAFLGYNLENLSITYCSFTSTYNMSSLPDGIKICDSAGVTGVTEAFSYGLKGNCEIAHNYLEGFSQYTIWIKNYVEGTYNIVDNTGKNIGRGNASYFCPLVRLVSYKGTGEATVNIQYNNLTNADGLLRADSGSITDKVTVHVNYNIVNDRLATNDIVNSTSVKTIDAENNFDAKGFAASGVTVTNSYTKESDVPTFSGVKGTTYNISYDLDGGEWEASYYTAAEIGEQFCSDYGQGMTYKLFDTSYTSAKYLTEMLQKEAYKTKWLWLLNAIYKLAGNGNSAYDPATADYSTSSFRAFYFANLFAFFNTTTHTDSNYNSESYDFSDPETGKAICVLGPIKSSITGATTYKSNKAYALSTPAKDGYAFVGWKTQNGDIINKITANMTGDLTLTAIWEKAVVAERIVITNLPETGIKLYDTLQLEWSIVPSNAYNKNVIFYVEDGSCFTITEGGLIKATSVGSDKLRVKLEGNPDYVEYIDIIVWSGEYFDASYETNSYVKIDDTIKLNATYIDSNSKVNLVTWSSLDETKATVDEKGNVKGIADGTVTIRATVVGQSDLTFDFTVTVLNKDLSKEVEYILENHNSNAFTRYNLGIGSGVPEYYYDVVGSVSNLIFDDLTIDRRYYDKLPEGTKNNGVMSSVEFITVHYTGNMKATADADNNCDYFNELSYAASIHYVTGRTNQTDITGQSSGYNEDAYLAFAGLNEKYGGWHASDSKLGSTVWTATGVKVSEDDPEKPVFGVSSNSKYTINGKETSITIPAREDGIVVTGDTFIYQGKECKSINDMGLAYKIVEGEYYMGNTWWGTQQYGYTLCSIGGNHNSIGIESCVDKGSDLWHTWHVTAQLVADIMVRYDLDISRVVGHHFFSGKDCPQPMLENDMEIWYLFLDMVQAEYDKLTTYKDVTFTAKAVKSDGILRDNGLLVQDNDAHCVTYEVTIQNGEATETITLSTCVESRYKCDCERTEESLQIAGYPII